MSLLSADHRLRLLSHPLSELALLQADEGPVSGPLVSLIALLGDQTPETPATLALARRIAGCSESGPIPRLCLNEDPSAYLSGFVHGCDALIRALVLPLPDRLRDLGAILADPDLDDADRIAAILARDPSAAWTSHALAFGPHPDDEGRFCVVADPAPIPDAHAVLDCTTGQIVLTRRDRSDAMTVAAMLCRFPESGQMLGEIRAGLDQARDRAQMAGLESQVISASLEPHRQRWHAAWTALRAQAEPWCNAMAIDLDAHTAQIRRVS